MKEPKNSVPLEAVRKTLVEIDTPAIEIYKETDLGPSWQQAFKEGRAKDPGYNRICILIGWLLIHHPATLQRHVDAESKVC